MPDAFYIRKAFRTTLHESGLSVRKAAKIAGVNPSSIQRLTFVDKSYAPTYDTLSKALTAFEGAVSYDDIMDAARTLESEARQSGAFWKESDYARDRKNALEEPVPILRKYKKPDEQKENDFLSTEHDVVVGASLLNAKRRQVTEDTMEPEICVGDDVLYTEVEEDCQDMAKTKDIVFGIYKETGREALVRLRRDGDTMWGVIENRDFPGDRQRELERITGIVVCAIKWYKRPSNLTNPA